MKHPPFTVQQLQEALAKIPPDLPVFIYEWSDDVLGPATHLSMTVLTGIYKEHGVVLIIESDAYKEDSK